VTATDPAPRNHAAVLVVGAAGGLSTLPGGLPDDVIVTDDAEEAAAYLGAEPGRATVAVLGRGCPRPLATGRRLRGIDPELVLVVLAPAGEVRPTRDRLALAPELGDLEVIDGDAPPGDVLAQLRERARAGAERRRLRRALDAMNRRMSPVAPAPGPATRSVSDRYLAALTRHLPQGVISVDVDGRVVTSNASAAPLLAVPADESEGRPLEEVLRADDPDDLAVLLDRAFAGETADLDACPLTDRDGRRRIVELTAAPVTGPLGRVVGLVLLLRDVTEDRRTEERLRELQKAESLATLAGGVAHDFNNLLVSVQSWAGLAADDLSDTEMVGTALEHIRTASRRAAELARSMLAYAGRGRFQLGATDLNEVVGEMASLLQASISRKIRIELDLVDELPVVVADATQVRQVVMNLVTNAAEAIGEERGGITIRTATREMGPGDIGGHGPVDLRPGRYAVVEVRDTGVGIDEATLGRIFDPFFTTKFTGRGLGLAASHGIVRAHGGGFEVTSQPGEGATLRILLPVQEGGS
jgi:PAS domain S-box-containing protein